MDKSMYSLILMDGLVQAVDKLAYENSTSRSNLINRILAEYLSMMTPEMLITEIFQEASRVAGGYSTLQVQSQSSGGLLVVKSVIAYKYNPTIRYSVEISMISGGYAGEFRAVSRSQSDALLDRLISFYQLWTNLERTCLEETLPGFALQYSVDGGRFRRTLVIQQTEQRVDSQRLGHAIGQYVILFDQAMKLYFSSGHRESQKIHAAMLEQYRQYLAGTPIVI